MKCNEKGLDIIRESEGLRLKAYICPAGKLTVGYGHTGKDVKPNTVITEETAEILLAQDVANSERSVKRLVTAPLNENQFSAITSFVFNLGESKLRGTTTLQVLNQKKYLEFADRLLLWNKSRDPKGNLVELRGLTERRKRERELFLTPMEA